MSSNSTVRLDLRFDELAVLARHHFDELRNLHDEWGVAGEAVKCPCRCQCVY